MSKAQHPAAKKAKKGQVDSEKQSKALFLQDAVRNRKLPWFDSSEGEGQAILREHYPGFKILPASVFPADLHSRISQSLQVLKREGFFQRDLVWVKGKLNQTRVRRLLLGEPGITYRYKGLRLFAVPWRCPDDQNVTEWRNSKTNAAAEELHHLTQLLQKESIAVADRLSQTEQSLYRHVGSLNLVNVRYNVTLINLFDPLDEEDQDHAAHLPPEPYYGMGPIAVSWHSDDGVVEGSSIAVYNSIEESQSVQEKSPTNGKEAIQRSQGEWKVGLKVAWDIETPGVAARMRNGEAYCMLAGFNERHQHCVLSGDSLRFSSTHRLVDADHSSFNYIKTKCQKALASWNQCRKLDEAAAMVEAIRGLEGTRTEVESDWLLQFHFQSQHHATYDRFWTEKISELEKLLECLQEKSSIHSSWVSSPPTSESSGPLGHSQSEKPDGAGGEWRGLEDKVRRILIDTMSDRTRQHEEWTVAFEQRSDIFQIQEIKDHEKEKLERLLAPHMQTFVRGLTFQHCDGSSAAASFDPQAL